jgi:thioredoxin 1
MKVKELLSAKEVVAIPSTGLILLDFYNEGCGACKLIRPFLEKLAQDYTASLQVYSFDVDKDNTKQIISRYTIQALPTLVLVKDGLVVDKIVGFRPYGFLEKWVSQYK